MPTEIKKERPPEVKRRISRAGADKPNDSEEAGKRPKGTKEARSKDSEKRSTVPCPKCGSFRLRRSHARGLSEQLLKYVNQRAYRCKDCGWRGYVNSKGRQSHRTSSSKGYTVGRIFFIGVALLITLYLLFYLVDWAHQDSGGQSQSSAFKGSGTVGG